LMKIVSTHKQIKSANRQKQKEFFRSLFSPYLPILALRKSFSAACSAPEGTLGAARPQTACRASYYPQRHRFPQGVSTKALLS
jgi:hypothetical protein